MTKEDETEKLRKELEETRKKLEEKEKVTEITPKDKKEVWEEGAVATETAPIAVNTKSGKQLTQFGMLIKMLNNQEELKQLLN